MAPKISVVMSYYNRLELLHFTLRTIECSPLKDSCEVIIVDDASDLEQAVSQIVDKVSLNIKLITIPREEKWWINPCVPFNRGFREASGDVVIIQSAECFHFGDLLSYAVNYTTEGNYLVYSTKQIPDGVTKILSLFNNSPCNVIKNKIQEIIEPLKDRTNQWYQHPVHNPTCYHFTSSIKRKNLIEGLGGFDERYAKGYCFDDNEFLERIRRSPFELVNVPPDSVFSVHQFHRSLLPLTVNKDSSWLKNYHLFNDCTKAEKTWKAN